MPSPEESGAAKPLRLRLYILSETSPSEAALANLEAIASEQLVGRFELEVVDVRDEPLRALSDGALLVPTLILVTEVGERRLVGDLSDTEALLRMLGLSSPRKG